MIQIILLIVGIFYFVKRPKLKRLSYWMFPNVPSHQFYEWQALALASIDIFLWATWGLAIVGTVVAWMLAAVMPESGRIIIFIGYIVLFFVGLTVSAIKGSKAAKLKKALGIDWPPR